MHVVHGSMRGERRKDSGWREKLVCKDKQHSMPSTPHATRRSLCYKNRQGAFPSSPSGLSEQRMQIQNPAKRILTDASLSYQADSSQSPHRALNRDNTSGWDQSTWMSLVLEVTWCQTTGSAPSLSSTISSSTKCAPHFPLDCVVHPQELAFFSSAQDPWASSKYMWNQAVTVMASSLPMKWESKSFNFSRWILPSD